MPMRDFRRRDVLLSDAELITLACAYFAMALAAAAILIHVTRGVL